MRNNKNMGSKKRREYLVEVVREMIAREATSIDEAKELAQYVSNLLYMTRWSTRKELGYNAKEPATEEVIKREYDQKFTVRNACNRAKLFGLPATLTLTQWLATVDHFNGMCAYCLVNPYQILEHFIPVELMQTDGGTTARNCIPACRSCNRKKGKTHPSQLTQFPKENVDAIQMYVQWL